MALDFLGLILVLMYIQSYTIGLMCIILLINFSYTLGHMYLLALSLSG